MTRCVIKTPPFLALLLPFSQRLVPLLAALKVVYNLFNRNGGQKFSGEVAECDTACALCFHYVRG